MHHEDDYDEDESDEVDEFEESADVETNAKRHNDKYDNKPYDEAYEMSQSHGDLSVAESFDGRTESKHGGGGGGREHKLANDKYDEAVEVSQSASFAQQQQTQPKGRTGALADVHGGRISYPSGGNNSNTSGPSSRSLHAGQPSILGEQTISTSISNRPFDEALEFSQDESEESFDTRNSDRRGKKQPSPGELRGMKKDIKPLTPTQGSSSGGLRSGGPTMGSAPKMAGGAQSISKQQQQQQTRPAPHAQSKEQDDDDEEEESSESGGEEQESYDNIEGAYNPKDYALLSVTAEIKDIFQHIERYKPHEVELETTLKCFIPEFIPSIGEMDGFIKVPRPDGKNDELGLKILDEPAAAQSDPTVLELQLRATSKKQQHGDVAVRSIENAEKNPGEIDKWIKNISDLHKSKPLPHVEYRRNMPDLEALMEIWPEEFETALDKLKLPSPDLDLSVLEYSKLLCAIVDIPVYENPIESLHHFFSLYMAFRDNPHFQAKRLEGSVEQGDLGNYGGADVMQITQGFK